MPPMTKIWFFVLKDGHNVTDPAFRSLWEEVLELCSSYTNPEPGSPHMHCLFQSVGDRSQLMMISGYPSTELNTACDKVYAEKYMNKMFEYVQHVWLRQLELDVRTLPIDNKFIHVTCGPAPPTAGQWVGSWDVWQSTQQAKQNVNGAQGVREGEAEGNKIFVSVSASPTPAEANQRRDGTEQFYLTYVLGR